MYRKNSIFKFAVVPDFIHSQGRDFVTHLLIKGGTVVFKSDLYFPGSTHHRLTLTCISGGKKQWSLGCFS